MKDLLKKSGLSDKEAGVYETLLSLGSSRVSAIAKKAHINRSTTYVILDSLAARGLVSMAEKRGARMFSAMSPRLIEELEKKAKQFSELARAVKKSVPKIKSAVVAETSKPKVQLFNGSEGVKTVYEDALSSLETIRSYAFSKSKDEAVSNETQNYYDHLAKKNIKVKMLFPNTSEARELVPNMKGNGGPLYNIFPEISIYNNKIVFMSAEEKSGLVIESQELADALKKAFDLSWQEARLTKKSFFGGAPEAAAGRAA